MASAAKETRILFRNIDEPKLASIRTYKRLGGYQAIRKAFK
jgi:NADH:ubiquinone oxidoreductase subunit F (NADH-binding)